VNENYAFTVEPLLDLKDNLQYGYAWDTKIGKSRSGYVMDCEYVYIMVQL
jgi:hypothetical protein